MKNGLLIAICALLAACGSSSISGKVTFEGEGDASGVVVSLVSTEKKQVQVTGADGAYKFDSVGEGIYQLTFDAPDAAESHKALAVSLKDGKGGEVPPVMMRGVGVISGKVTADGPTGNLGIQVSVAGTTMSAMAADDGSFTLPGVPTGQRTLVATRGNYISSTTVTVQRGALNAAEFNLGKKGLREGIVKGSVQYWDARPASDIQLSVPGVLAPAPAASNGSFSLTLPTGEWEVVATAPSYPRQVVARVKVEADTTTNVGIRKLTGYYRFGVTDPSQYSASSRLFEDGVHALVSREGFENITHSIVDLQTGEERMFLVEWNWITDPTEWTASTTGQFLAYGQYSGDYDSSGSWRDYSEINVFNTRTAERFMLRGPLDSYPSQLGLWSFSGDGAFFFGLDNKRLHRMKTADGTVTSVAADAKVMKGDAEHFLAIARGEGGSAVGDARWVTTSRGDVVLPMVQTDAPMGQFGQYGVLLTDCDSSSDCDVKVVNLLTGTVATATGGKYPKSSALRSTNHGEWARIEGGKSAYLHLTDGAATAYPSGYSSSIASTAKINPDGTRVAFQVPVASYSLYLTAMPPTAIPAVAAESSAEMYNYTWLSASRFLATTTDNSRLLDQKNDTLAPVAGVVPGSVRLTDFTATYRRDSDKAQMALVGDLAAIPLSDADPNSEIQVRLQFNPWSGDVGIFQSKDKSWTGWTLFNEANGRYTTVMLKRGSTTPKRFLDLRNAGAPERDSSTNGMLAYRMGFDYQAVAIDFETGIMKQLWETDVDDWDYGAFHEKGPQDYLMMTLLSGRSIQLYNGSGGTRTVYETGLLKY